MIKTNKNTETKKASFYTMSEVEAWVGNLDAIIEEIETPNNVQHSVYYKVTVYINKEV